jgi:hypothetical protein
LSGPFQLGTSISAPRSRPLEHLSTGPFVFSTTATRSGTPRRPRTSTGAEKRPRKGLEISRPKTSAGASMTMEIVTRPGAVRSMTFPRAVMSDVELRSEWSSSESGSIKGELNCSIITCLINLGVKGKLPMMRSRKNARQTTESERMGRMTMESERGRMTEESDRPSVDQKRFGSLLRVRDRTHAPQSEVEAYSDSEHTTRKGRKRGSWLAGLGFKSRGPSPSLSPSGSRAPSPSPAPSLAAIPSLSPISSPFGPVFQVLPATPMGKLDFGGAEEGVWAEENQTLYDEPVSQVTGSPVRRRADLTEHEPR